MTSEVNPNFQLNVVVNEPLTATTDNDASTAEVLLEYLSDVPRITSLVAIPAGGTLPDYQGTAGLEILVIDGGCSDGHAEFLTGSYMRFPHKRKISSDQGCILFVKYNQFQPGDDGERNIDTKDPQGWLPGPVEGISIRPLHVYNTESIMLLRWQRACEFRPKLDPQGEEILVVSGLLQNKNHLHKSFSWLRNPVEDWLDWHGGSNTLLYYKSGHFPR